MPAGSPNAGRFRRRVYVPFLALVTTCLWVAGPMLGEPLAASDEAAAWRRLAGHEIASHFDGRTLEGRYADGRWWSERIHADGTTDYREDSLRAAGRHWIEGDLVCFAYVDPPVGSSCFIVWQRSANCYDVYSRDTEMALWQQIVGLGWDARFWHDASRPTCPGGAVS